MTSLPKLTILGGSSPFTVELINCLAVNSENKVGPYYLVLFGRNLTNLELIYNYAKFHLSNLGWILAFSTDINQALDGVDIVIHQNRYGGFEGRLQDEAFSNENGLPLDETLGPCGLRAALRMAPYLKVLAKRLRTLCPGALIINLTNPLSLAVSLLHYWGVSNVIGICELPLATINKVADLLEVPVKQLKWEYSGLNHRGFIYNIKINNKDFLPIFLEKIASSGFQGFDRSVIENLEAIPLKYFQLFSKYGNTEARAMAVKAIGDNIRDELILNPFKSPASIKFREMGWYKNGIIDVLQAVNSSKPKTLIINKPGENHLTLESKANISSQKITLVNPGKVPGQAQKWFKIFIKHEQEVFKAVLNPSLKSLNDALSADPLVNKSNVSSISQILLSTI